MNEGRSEWMCMFLMAMRGGMIPALAIRLRRQRQALLQTRHPRLPPSHLPHVKLPHSLPGESLCLQSLIWPSFQISPKPDLCSHKVSPALQNYKVTLDGIWHWAQAWHLGEGSSIDAPVAHTPTPCPAWQGTADAHCTEQPCLPVPAFPGEAAFCKPAGMLLTCMGAGLNPWEGGLIRAHPLSPASLKSRARKWLSRSLNWWVANSGF